MHLFILSMTSQLISEHRFHLLPGRDDPEFPQKIADTIYRKSMPDWTPLDIGNFLCFLEPNQIDPGNHRAYRVASSQGDVKENIYRFIAFCLGVIIRDRLQASAVFTHPQEKVVPFQTVV